MKKILLLISLVLASVLSYAQVNAPTAIKAQQVNQENKALVEWTAPTGGAVTGYKVYYKIKGASQSDSAKVATVSHTLTGLTQDTVYVIRVKAFKVNAPADTTYSTNTDSVSVLIAKPLVKPEVSIQAPFTTPNKIVFRLVDTNLYETGFEIVVEGGGQTIPLTYEKVNGEAVVTVQNLKPKTIYKVKARALRKVSDALTHEGPWSDDQYETTKVDLPPAAINFKMEADCPYGVAFSWDYAERQEDLIYVLVESSFDGWNFSNIGSVPVSEKFFYYTGAEPGVNYFYRVTTQNATGQTFSGPFQIFTKPYVAPNPPQNVRSLQGATEKYTTFLTVAWDLGDQDNACKTNIIVNTEIAISVNGGPMKVIANLPNYTRQLKIGDLNPNDIVDIYFRSHSDKGHISQWVSTRDKTYGPSSIPQGFIGVDGVDAFGRPVLYLSWDDVSDEGQYYIERSIDGGPFTRYAILKQDIVKMTDTDLEEGRTYSYRIQSANWAGASDYSRVISFVIKYSIAPNAPYGLVAKRNGNAVDLTWVDDTNKEDKYLVERSVDTDNNFGQIGNTERDGQAYRDNGVLPGKTYFYRVRASNPIGFSDYTKTVKVEIPAAASASVSAFVFDATVYPNPVSETLNIKAEGVDKGASYRLRIFDSNNHLVLDKEILFKEENTASVSIRSLAPGAYNMTLSDSKDKVSRKLIKL